MIKLDYRYVLDAITQKDIDSSKERAMAAFDMLMNKTGKGNQYLGWVNLPIESTTKEIEQIIEAANKIRKESDVLVVIGIGGSYLGAKAALDMLKSYYHNDFEVIFVGNTLSSTFTQETLEYLKNRDFSVNIISKSGTTTEPAIAFRLLKELLEEKYGSEAKNRIYITTDPVTGVLRKQVETEGYTSFTVPANVGGRYSVLTAVGLLPIACSGIDIKEIMAGAKDAAIHYQKASFENNDAIIYALLRNLLYDDGKLVEVFVSYEPKLDFLSEWLKQLFAESEGKDHKGLYPSALIYTTSLHSVGQYIQDGSRVMFETVLNVINPEKDIIIKADKENLDGLNYLSDKSLNYVNQQSMYGTIMAHVAGGVPNILLNIDKISPYNFGYLVYFFMFTCGISGYILGVNPFDQEGVEAYKRNMFALLGKEGYEDLREKLKGK